MHVNRKFIKILLRIFNKSFILKPFNIMFEYIFLKNTVLFDENYYLSIYEDVKLKGCNPLLHFILHGKTEKRNPHPLIDTAYYLSCNSDVFNSKMNPLVHYLLFGEKEDRNPHYLFDCKYYGQNIEVDVESKSILEYFITKGHADNVSIHPKLEGECNAFINKTDMKLLKEYLVNGEFVNFSKLASKLSINFGSNNSNSISYNDYTEVKEKEYKVISVKEYAENREMISFYQDQDSWNLEMQTVDENILISLPPAYIATLNSVSVIGGTRLILHDKNLLHDEMAKYTSCDYGEKAWQYVKLKQNGNAVIFKTRQLNFQDEIQEGILISCDHDNNYFHWMIECLPKVLMLLNRGLIKKIPLLVAENLHKNFIKSLISLIGNDYPIFRLKDGYVYNVKKLIYPSDLSRILDRYHGKVISGEDVSISPKYIMKMRNEFFKSDTSNINIKRKLYLTRRSGTYRKMLNEEDIELELLKRGFEVVDLAGCSFEYQKELFRQADLVVAPTGATVTNILLAKESTNWIVLTSNHDGVHFALWEQIAAICKVNIKHCTGYRAFNREDFHDDFVVPIENILELLPND